MCFNNDNSITYELKIKFFLEFVCKTAHFEEHLT